MGKVKALFDLRVQDCKESKLYPYLMDLEAWVSWQSPRRRVAAFQAVHSGWNRTPVRDWRDG